VVAVRGRKVEAIAVGVALGGAALCWMLARDAASGTHAAAGARRDPATLASRSDAGSAFAAEGASPAATAASAARDPAAPHPQEVVTPLAGPRDDARPEAGEMDPETELAAARLQRRMQRFLSNLEYTPGLPEPPQQVIAPTPPPWTPPAALADLPQPVIDEISPRAAAEGAHVSIRGRHLRVSQVMFGGLPAEVVSDGDDHVTVVVPAGGHGVVSIGLTNVDGTYAVADDAFTYTGGDQ
jgi:hypothetical protein